MAGTSALLKSAQAQQKKVRTQQDQLVAFEWENSAQTYEDFLTYSKYLEDRAEKSNDVSDKLTYQTKIRSARRSYTSNELQRQQMAIMEGRATTADKLAAIKGLYDQAVDNGDLNLAQNLFSQWDALTIKLQNEQEVASKAFAAAGEKVQSKLLNDLQKGVDDVTLPTGQRVTPLSQISKDLEETGGDSFTWQAAQDTLEAIQGVIVDQYQNATTQDQIDKLEEKYGAGLQDLNKEVTFSIGGKKLNTQDVVNAIANEQLNNPIYSLKAIRNEATGKNEFKLVDNNVERLDYARQFDEQGNEYYAPVSIRTDQEKLMFGQSDQGRGLGTQITNEGAVIGGGDRTGKTMAGETEVNRDPSQSIENRLKGLGIIARQNGTTLTIKLPGESVEREATIQPDGSIRYFADDGQLIEVPLVRKNLGTDLLPQIVEAGQQRIVAPDEISDFGAKSAFGGDLSKMSKQGERYISSITGSSRVNSLQTGAIRTGNDFSGLGGPATSGAFQGSSALLQGAQFTKQSLQQEQQRQQMLQAQQQALQSTNNFDLNQTPVQQLASNGVLRRQLQVAAPAPTPRLYVAPPISTPQITGVGVARTGPITGVSVAPAQPRVRVY